MKTTTIKSKSLFFFVIIIATLASSADKEVVDAKIEMVK